MARVYDSGKLGKKNLQLGVKLAEQGSGNDGFSSHKCLGAKAKASEAS